MSVVQLNAIELGQSGLLPRTVKMVSTANLATITTAGYLSNRNMIGIDIVPTDKIECLYNYDADAGTGSLVILVPSISAGVITLNKWTIPA